MLTYKSLKGPSVFYLFELKLNMRTNESIYTISFMGRNSLRACNIIIEANSPNKIKSGVEFLEQNIY